MNSVVPLLVTGVVLGPQGLGLLSVGALAAADPALPVALAALGVLVGFDVGALRAETAIARAAVVEAIAATVAVGAGLALAAGFVPDAGLPPWPVPLLGGLAAASSLALPRTTRVGGHPPLDTFLAVGVVAPMVIGGAWLAWVRQQSVLGAASLTVQAIAIALVLATAAWLLLRQTASATEQRVFAVAATLLVGGAADYLSWSALLSGAVAGTLWARLGGEAREHMLRDVRYARHPLVALVLLVAGARVEPSWPAVGLAAVYVCLRAGARLAGAAALARTAVRLGPHAGVSLVAPGVFGVAFALNAYRAVGQDLSVALSMVVVGTIAADLFAGTLGRHEDAP